MSRDETFVPLGDRWRARRRREARLRLNSKLRKEYADRRVDEIRADRRADRGVEVRRESTRRLMELMRMSEDLTVPEEVDVY